MRLLTSALTCSIVATTPLWAHTPAAACGNTHYVMRQLPFLPEVISTSGVVAGTDEVSRVDRSHLGPNQLQQREPGTVLHRPMRWHGSAMRRHNRPGRDVAR